MGNVIGVERLIELAEASATAMNEFGIRAYEPASEWQARERAYEEEYGRFSTYLCMLCDLHGGTFDLMDYPAMEQAMLTYMMRAQGVTQ